MKLKKKRKVQTVVEEPMPVKSVKREPKTSPKKKPENAVANEYPLTSFQDLGVLPWICQDLQRVRVLYPTKIQVLCIPRILKGEDLFGLARTGSGKTMCFLIPLLQDLSRDPFGIYALILSPVRELAAQINEQVEALCGKHYSNLVITGRMDMIAQCMALAKRPHFVVSTPGRLHQLLENNSDLDSVFEYLKVLVVDEVDRFFGEDFKEPMDIILRALPKERQTLLFSATQSFDLHLFEARFASKLQLVQDDLQQSDIQQEYLMVPPTKTVKLAYLVYILTNFLLGTDGLTQVIIFGNRIEDVEETALTLELLGMSVASLHSLHDQADRFQTVADFKGNAIQVLVCTDIASRGLDIPLVSSVINLDFPSTCETYIHRIGRTGRMGQQGQALTFLTLSDVPQLLEFEGQMQVKLQEFARKQEIELEKEDFVFHEGKSKKTVVQVQATKIAHSQVVLGLARVTRKFHKAKLMLLEMGFSAECSDFRRYQKAKREKVLR